MLLILFVLTNWKSIFYDKFYRPIYK